MCPGSPPGCGRGPQDLEPPETLPEPTAGRSVWIFGLGPRARLLPSPVPSRWSQQAARVPRIAAGVWAWPPGLEAAGGGARECRGRQRVDFRAGAQGVATSRTWTISDRRGQIFGDMLTRDFNGAGAHRGRQRVKLRAGASAQGAAASQAGALSLAAAGRQGAKNRRRGVDVAPGLEPPEAVPGPTVGGSVRISGAGPIPRARLLPRPVPYLWP